MSCVIPGSDNLFTAHYGDLLATIAVFACLMQFFASLEPASRTEIPPELTERKREILSFITDMQTNAEIAEKLVISMKTVRNHVSNIFSKLQVADRAQTAIRAREAGLGI